MLSPPRSATSAKLEPRAKSVDARRGRTLAPRPEHGLARLVEGGERCVERLGVARLQRLKGVVLREAFLNSWVGRVELWRGGRLWCGGRLRGLGLRRRDKKRPVLGQKGLGGEAARDDRPVAGFLCVRRGPLVPRDAFAEQSFERDGGRSRSPRTGHGCGHLAPGSRRHEQRPVFSDERIGGESARGDRKIAGFLGVRRATLVTSNAFAEERVE